MFKRRLPLILTVCTAVLLSGHVTAQKTVNGIINSAFNGLPVPYASIGIAGKNAGAISDSGGHFRLALSNDAGYNDTVIISSIGYAEKKYSLRDFLLKNTFSLNPVDHVLDEVKVARFSHTGVYGTISAKRRLNSGWSGIGNGGEIGNIFHIPSSLFKIESLAFYILTGCDTTVFRLHIREFIDGYPGKELLIGNIIMVITKQDGICEQDLSKFNLLFADNPNVYVSLELIARSKAIANAELGNNVHITGHKGGFLYYRWYPQTPWLINRDYELSLTIKAKY